MRNLRYNIIRDYDVVNGNGIAVSIYFQGCSHHCKNCFNQETWDFNGGQIFTQEKQLIFESLCKRDFVKCISLLGGDPLDQPLDKLEHFLKVLKKNTNKPIYMWTGYTFKQIKKDKAKRKILKYVDVLIDGEFDETKHDFRLELRGSSNQHIYYKNKFGFWIKKC